MVVPVAFTCPTIGNVEISGMSVRVMSLSNPSGQMVEFQNEAGEVVYETNAVFVNFSTPLQLPAGVTMRTTGPVASRVYVQWG